MRMLADNYRPVLFARALALVPAPALALGVIEAMAVYPDHVRVLVTLDRARSPGAGGVSRYTREESAGMLPLERTPEERKSSILV